MTDVLLVVGVAVVIIGAFFLRSPQRRPPSRIFKCGRCGKAAHHDERTSNAWRNGKTRFFCQACHARWLRDQPARETPVAAGRSAGGRSGCMGALVVLLGTPISLLLVWLSR